jgi:hypothetical protein
VLKNPNPQAVREGFQSRLPDGTHAVHPSTLHFPFMDMTILEQVDADRARDQFAVQGYLPLGMLVYDLSGDKRAMTINTAAEQFNDYKYILQSIGHDLRHVYLDLTPDPSAKATVWSKEVFYAQKTPEGTLCFEFAYDPPVLIEKRLSGVFGTVWSIRYYDYRPGPDGKVRPHGVVVDNKRYFYRIVLRGNDREQAQTVAQGESSEQKEAQ